MGEENQTLDSTETKALLIDLKNQIKEANQILNTLKPLTANAEIHKAVFDEIITRLETSHKEIVASKTSNTKYLNDLKTTKAEITAFIDESKSNIIEIKTIISSIKESQNKANKWLENIETLKSQSNTSKKEITAKKGEIDKLFKSINAISTKAQKFLTQIEEDKGIADEITKKLKEIIKQAETNSNELLWFYKKGKENFDKIETQSKKIDNFEKLSSENYSKIQEYFDRLLSWIKWKEPIKKQIEDILTKIKSNQEQIDNQLQDSTANRLCIAFKDKEEKLKTELIFWKDKVFSITIWLILINLVLLSVWPVLGWFNIKFKIEIWEHLGIILPLAILLWFSILEHGRIKQILDEYSFKYISAFSMPAYHELLESRDEQKSINFLIDTIENIYQNPSHKINSNSKSTMVDYIFDFIKEIKGMFWKNNITIPDLKATIWEYAIEVKKDSENVVKANNS